MLVVAICSQQAARMLADGVGPELAPDARCPSCEGALGPWPGYTRLVRHDGHTTRLRVRRCRCRRCGRTHALLPSFLLAYRRDLVAAVAGAVAGAVGGTGHRTLARPAGVPAATVRGWLRRARRNPPARATLIRMLVDLGGEPPRPSARGDPLNWLVDAIAAVHQTARARLAAIDECPFNVASAITNGRLLGRCA
jgi:hypothetical protein